MKEIINLSEKNQQRAWQIIQDINIVSIWESMGATINLVGSLKTKLMMLNHDIDFHVYTSNFTLEDSFAAVAKLALHPSVKRVEFNNFLKEIDACVSWNVWIEDCDGEWWHIDIIHILKNSRYDGYFEKVAERINSIMTDEIRNTILKLKFQTPADTKIMGVEYYRAVIEGGVKTFEELNEWRKINPANGIVEWMP